MLSPIDGWTVAHAFIGFLFGKNKIAREIVYSLQIGWETYQLLFHYQPQGYHLGYIWLNSLTDIIVCSVFYEITLRRYNFIIKQLGLWTKLNNTTKAFTLYIMITTGIMWALWDDVFRLKLSSLMPSVHIPLVIGAFSPVVASIFVRKWVNQIPRKIYMGQLLFFFLTGLIPSLIILLILYLIYY
jgi:hypothetical protein